MTFAATVPIADIVVNSENGGAGEVQLQLPFPPQTVGGVCGTPSPAPSPPPPTARNECRFPVTTNNRTTDLVAIPSAGSRLVHWGGACTGAPGAVCHLFIPGASRQAIAVFRPVDPQTTPQIALSPSSVGEANPLCPVPNSVGVVGNGFLPGEQVNVFAGAISVATAQVGPNGQFTVSYTTPLSGAFYEIVHAVGASGDIGSSDAYLFSAFCTTANSSPLGSGVASFDVAVSALDANASYHVILDASMTAFSGMTDAKGSDRRSITFACSPGQHSYLINTIRGAGTSFEFPLASPTGRLNC